jgi:hypothetical protein
MNPVLEGLIIDKSILQSSLSLTNYYRFPIFNLALFKTSGTPISFNFASTAKNLGPTNDSITILRDIAHQSSAINALSIVAAS